MEYTQITHAPVRQVEMFTKLHGSENQTQVTPNFVCNTNHDIFHFSQGIVYFVKLDFAVKRGKSLFFSRYQVISAHTRQIEMQTPNDSLKS